MLRSGLVPRRFGQFGVAGGSLALVTALLVLSGAYDQSSGASFILTLPEAVWELSLGIYLIVKGFRRRTSCTTTGATPAWTARLIPAPPAPAGAAPRMTAA
jgi:hypothetical protein